MKGMHPGRCRRATRPARASQPAAAAFGQEVARGHAPRAGAALTRPRRPPRPRPPPRRRRRRRASSCGSGPPAAEGRGQYPVKRGMQALSLACCARCQQGDRGGRAAAAARDMHAPIHQPCRPFCATHRALLVLLVLILCEEARDAAAEEVTIPSALAGAFVRPSSRHCPLRCAKHAVTS